MKLVIEIRMDNAAFERLPGNEVMRLLRQVSHVIEPDRDDPSAWEMPLIDVNGNRVGCVSVES